MVKVALDIGHGSNTFPPDKGVYKNGKGYAEHDFNSKLVMAINPLLKVNGIQAIIYQKPNSPDVPLKQRTDYYNAQKVDLVYSIHANANSDSNVNGRCVFYWGTSTKSKKMADIIVEEIKKAGYSTHGNGLHAGERGSWTNLHINRETNMPAVLVENGFMTGNKDFDLIFGSKQSEYIKDMAEVHAKAICRYFGIKYNGKTGTNKPAASTPKKSKQRGVATVTVPTLNLRDKPSTSGKLIRKLSKGEAYKVWEEKNGWLRLGKDMWASWQNGVYMDWTEKPTKSKPKKKPNIKKLADKIINDSNAPKGHEARRKWLGISQSDYNKVRNEVNRRYGVSKKKSPNIKKLADKVINSTSAPTGREARRKWLGVSKATYNKVQKEINRRFK